MNLGPENARYIVMQRSDFQGKSNVTQKHIADVEREAKTLSKFFPEKMESFLDIGCGIGALTIAIAEISKANAFVIDNDGEIDLRGVNNGAGFHDHYLFYSNLDLIRQNFRENGLHVETLSLDSMPDVDFVVSTLSCGFHYPISTYQALLNNLRVGARVVFDIRVGLNQNPGAKFEKIGLVEHFTRWDGQKHKADRICWEKVR